MVKTGYIYKLCCNNLDVTEVYVGSTMNIRTRKNGHKSDCNNEHGKNYNIPVYKFIRANGGFENWSMVMLTPVEFNIRAELNAFERAWVERLNASLNCQVPNRTAAEWVDDNKKHIAQRSKQYRVANAEQIARHKKQYYAANNEQIAQYNKQYYAANKEQLNQKHKQYHEANKEQLNQKYKQYCDANRQAIRQKQTQKLECVCYKTYSRSNKAVHKRSKHHQQYQELYDFIHS